jgi:hypothetical protein
MESRVFSDNPTCLKALQVPLNMVCYLYHEA